MKLTNSSSVRNAVSLAGVMMTLFLCGCAETQATLQNGSGSLLITQQTDKAAAMPGDRVMYTVTVQNKSDAAIADIKAEDVFPQEQGTLLSASGALIMVGKVEWNVGSLLVAQKKTMRFSVRLDSDIKTGDKVVNTVKITQPAMEARTQTSALVIGTAPAQEQEGMLGMPLMQPSLPAPTTPVENMLAVTQTADRTVLYPGDIVRFTITVRNKSLTPVTDIKVRSDFPAAQADILSVSDAVINGSTMRWSMGTLAPGEAHVIRYALRVKPTYAKADMFYGTVTAEGKSGDVMPQTGVEL